MTELNGLKKHVASMKAMCDDNNIDKIMKSHSRMRLSKRFTTELLLYCSKNFNIFRLLHTELIDKKNNFDKAEIERLFVKLCEFEYVEPVPSDLTLALPSEAVQYMYRKHFIILSNVDFTSVNIPSERWKWISDIITMEKKIHELINKLLKLGKSNILKNILIHYISIIDVDKIDKNVKIDIFKNPYHDKSELYEMEDLSDNSYQFDILDILKNISDINDYRKFFIILINLGCYEQAKIMLETRFFLLDNCGFEDMILDDVTKYNSEFGNNIYNNIHLNDFVNKLMELYHDNKFSKFKKIATNEIRLLSNTMDLNDKLINLLYDDKVNSNFRIFIFENILSPNRYLTTKKITKIKKIFEKCSNGLFIKAILEYSLLVNDNFEIFYSDVIKHAFDISNFITPLLAKCFALKNGSEDIVIKDLLQFLIDNDGCEKIFWDTMYIFIQEVFDADEFIPNISYINELEKVLIKYNNDAVLMHEDNICGFITHIVEHFMDINMEFAISFFKILCKVFPNYVNVTGIYDYGKIFDLITVWYDSDNHNKMKFIFKHILENEFEINENGESFEITSNTRDWILSRAIAQHLLELEGESDEERDSESDVEQLPEYDYDDIGRNANETFKFLDIDKPEYCFDLLGIINYFENYEDDKCCICLEDSYYLIKTSCRHCFCLQCAINWYRKNPDICTMCRQQITWRDCSRKIN